MRILDWFEDQFKVPNVVLSIEGCEKHLPTLHPALLLLLLLFPCLVCAHLGVLIAVSSRVFQVLACAFIAVGVQVDGAGRSLRQELGPNVLCPLCHVLLGHPLQVLHRQPEAARQINFTSDNYLT